MSSEHRLSDFLFSSRVAAFKDTKIEHGLKISQEVQALFKLAGDDFKRKGEVVDAILSLLPALVRKGPLTAQTVLADVFKHAIQYPSLIDSAFEAAVDNLPAFAKDSFALGVILTDMERVAIQKPHLIPKLLDGLLTIVPDLTQFKNQDDLHKVVMTGLRVGEEEPDWTQFLGSALTAVASLDFKMAKHMIGRIHTLRFDEARVHPSLAAIPALADKNAILARDMLVHIAHLTDQDYLLEGGLPILCEHFARTERSPDQGNATWFIPARDANGMTRVVAVIGTAQGSLAHLRTLFNHAEPVQDIWAHVHFSRIEEQGHIFERMFEGEMTTDQAADLIEDQYDMAFTTLKL